MWKKSLVIFGATALIALASPALAEVESDYFGHWVNNNPATKSIVSIDIADAPGTDIRIHPYGACHPTPCDWGSVNAQRQNVGPGFRYVYTFNQGFATKRMVLNVTAPGALKVITVVHFTDGSGRSDYTSHDYMHHP